MNCFAEIIVDVPNLPPLTYKVPEGVDVAVGDRCVVPVGRREMVGMIVGLSDKSEVPANKQKSILRALTEIEPVTEGWLELTRFAADYYQHSQGEVVFSSLPSFFKSKPRPQYLLSLEKLRKLKTKVSENSANKRPELNNEQVQAVDAVVESKGFMPFVLFGVTGSGKTEVYLNCAEQILSQNPTGQVLFLVPEINLTPQLEKRIKAYFADKVVVSLHSGLTATERARSWLAIHENRAQILIGTRMAVFADFQNLALIVVDEEHDASYKAGDGIRYSAKDLAIKRAHMNDIPVILGSATPSLEVWEKVRSGRYQLLSLTQRAVKGAVLPRLELADPRNEPTKFGFCDSIIRAIDSALSKKEQVIVFLNRRGYAPVITCSSCGWLSQCPHCSTYAVYHKPHRRIVCHHCGWSRPVHTHCPDCGNADLIPVGAGTQRIEETLAELWPQARILRIDRDTTTRKDAAKQAFEAVHLGEVDILVGTQMVAKGHDFQNVSTVVVLNIDSQLVSANARAEERAFANLMQVSGRAGRGGSQAKMLVQTRFGDRHLFKALAQQSYPLFADALLEQRQMEGAVPFVSQALFIADATQLNKCLEFLNEVAQLAQRLAQSMSELQIAVYDPIPMALMRVADKERAQLLIEGPNRVALNRFMRVCYQEVQKISTSVHWVIDVDPLEV